MFIATLIAVEALAEGDISQAADAVREAGAVPAETRWVERGVAADIGFAGDPAAVRAALEGLVAGADVVVQPEKTRGKRLMVADMDSTMITVECIDELADYAGIKAKVAAITERAMRGELDFAGALAERVALLEGLDADIVTRCHDERVRIMPGAKALVRTMRRNGARCVLVSGGFTLFADRVAAEIGFDRAVANVLEIRAGALSGTVAQPIVDSAVKQRVLREEQAALGLAGPATMAIGDGANDLAMIEVAGLGVAYRAKPKLREAADARIEHGDLSALLYAQGYRRREWTEE